MSILYFYCINIIYLLCLCIFYTVPYSMFSLTNETFNIWTHVLGFVYFSLVLLEDNIVLIPEAEGNYGDHFTFSIMNICYLVRCAKTVPFSLHLSCETLPLTPSPLTLLPPHSLIPVMSSLPHPSPPTPL